MAFWTVCGSLKLPKLQKSTATRAPLLLSSPIELRSLTGSEAGLLFPLGEVGVRVEVGLQGRRVDGFTPAFPFDQMGHSALSHGRGFGHMVLDYLGNPCRGRKQQVVEVDVVVRRNACAHRGGRIVPVRRSLEW